MHPSQLLKLACINPVCRTNRFRLKPSVTLKIACLLCLATLQAISSGGQPITKIAGGGYHSLFLKNGGGVWAMGYNADGELGDGTTNNTDIPERIMATNVTAIAAGGYHSLFLKSDGSLWAMGYNADGELGDRTYNSTNQPEEIVASNVRAIATGFYHSLFLESGGSLWAMGQDANGQLGDGTYGGISGYINQPEQIVAGGVTAIAAGWYHSLFLKSDGSLWGMGANFSGQLGDGSYGAAPNYGPGSPEQIVAAYDRISGQLFSGGIIRLFFVGVVGVNYALDRSFSLAPANWVPQATNPAAGVGTLVFTNTPDPTTNNFWRIRSVP